MKRSISILLLVALLILSVFSFSGKSFAEEVTTPVEEDNIDESWEPYCMKLVYEYYDNLQHIVKKYMVFINSQGELMVNGVPSEIYNESHSVSFSYSGQNYHSGSRHFFLYTGTCTKCEETITRWESASCPGNGHCIEPQDIPPVSE